MSQHFKVATEVWIATALLHHDSPDEADFSVREIIDRVIDENLTGEYRPGIQTHTSQHCVANKRPSPNNYRMLYETRRGRRRLFRPDDDHHPFRKAGKTVPDPGEISEEYHYLLEWYERVYCTESGMEEEQSPPELKKAVPDARGEQHESSTILGQLFQQQAADIISTHWGIELLLEQAILIGDPAKEHRFDLVSTDQSHVGECKDYRWTETGNVPSAKISGINEAVLYLSCLPDGTTRFVVMPKSVHPSRNETLAEFYSRTYRHLLKDIQIIELDAALAGAREIGLESVVGRNKMSFYVYENWQAGPHKAVIHAGSCGYCNEGTGKDGGYNPSYAKWHGPYPTFEEAESASESLSGVVVRKECRCVSRVF